MLFRCDRRWAAWCVVVGSLLASAVQADEGTSPEPAPAPASTPAPSAPREGAPVDRAVISPDGKHIAAVVPKSFGNEVVLIDTSDFSTRTLLVSRWVYANGRMIQRDPWRVSWVNSQWLAVDYPFSAEAVDLSGKRVAELGARVIGHVGWQAPDEPTMLVYDDEEHESVSVINVRTRERRRIRVPMSGDPLQWAFDGRGELRAVLMASSAFWDDRTTLSYWYRRLDSDEWTKLEEVGLGDGDHWLPLAASSSADELTVVSREGRDTWAVFAYDPIERRLGRMLAGSPKEDMRVVSGIDADQVRGVISHGMKPRAYWFDPRMTALQSEVDKALPGCVNQISGNPGGRVLIFSYSDLDPGRWFLLNTADMTMLLLLEARSGVQPSKMRPMETMSYPAKDGLAIPAYLTRPAAASGPQPMVVMVHGGPALRDDWGWDPDVQMLAEEGYVVFQPQFRGSNGFGKAFERAGYGQWGLAMQDDITAGVEYLIEQGIADPRRICIYGASYGGYAAVWGLVKTPELYRCGITLAGVSDVGYMLNDWSDRNSNKLTREVQRFRVGDKRADQAKFDEVSPLLHAQRIRAPLLIAHGEDDQRVPPSHARKLMKALDKQQKAYEWLPLPGEGHSLSTIHRVRFFDKLLQFLDKHIGRGASTSQD